MRWVSPIPQRYNLKAIHNNLLLPNKLSHGVTNTSKIQSESNSQLLLSQDIEPKRCHQYLKDTIWKQFTTGFIQFDGAKLVSPIPQRYNLKAIHNASGSWPILPEVSPIPQRYNLKAIHNIYRLINNMLLVSPIPQRYNLKAIHNKIFSNDYKRNGVTNTSKIQSESNSQLTRLRRQQAKRCHQYLKDTIWKQFTTRIHCSLIFFEVSPIPQRYNLKAIHNNCKLFLRPVAVSPIPQRYNLKAIHNQSLKLWSFGRGVTNTSKIQSESNSQRSGPSSIRSSGCHQYLKDTIWKQFTTGLSFVNSIPWVSPIPQRYNLKAIHNA